MQSVKKNAGVCLLSGLITLLIFAGVLFFKGIFPFGGNLIDYYDMGQTNAPLYYHIWDFLHGKSALFFDWYIDLSQNLSMGSSIQWNISPFNLYFLIIPRNLVYRSLSVFMGLHLFFMAFNMCLFLRAVFPDLKRYFLIPAAVSYGLCGFTLTHYTIPTYLDTAAFLPLFAISLFMLLRGRGKLMYTLMLGFMTALSYYLGFMHLIYVLLFSGAYIFLEISDSSERKKRAADLAIGTLGGMLLSSVIFLPSVMEMTTSSRFNSNLSEGPVKTLISILNSIGADEYYVKFLQFFAMELFIVIIIVGVIKYRAERKRVALILAGAFIPCALAIFESINILWHFGTYYHYPIRCGYLIPFSLIAAAACFYGKMDNEAGEKPSFKVILVPAVLSVIGLTASLTFYFRHEIWDIKLLFRYWIPLSAIVFLIMLILFLRTGQVKKALLLSLPILSAELILGAVIGYGMPHFTDSFFGDPEQSGEYILKAEAVEEAASDIFTENDDVYRIKRMKNPDTDLNANYGMVIRHGTVGGWANTATREELTMAEKLGYSTHFMRILDSGGTLLSDSILQVHDIADLALTLEETEDVYKLRGEYRTDQGDFRIFENETVFPFAMAVSEEIEDEDFLNNSIAENNNAFYWALSGDEEEIASVTKAAELNGVKITSGISEGKIDINGRKALYLVKGKADEILVNGKTVPVPTIGDLDNTSFPAWFNSNLLYLGIYENETLTIECPEKSRLITLDIDKLVSLSRALRERNDGLVPADPIAGKSGLSFTVKGDEKRTRALIPLAYSPGWEAEVNGEKRSLSDLGGMFMTLPIDDGENEVRLSFTPPGLREGACVSLITALIILILSLSGRAKAAGNMISEHVEGVLYRIFIPIFGAAVLFLYIIPIFWTIIHVVLKKLLSLI